MSPRLAIATGLLSGVVVAALVITLLVVALPAPGTAASPSPLPTLLGPPSVSPPETPAASATASASGSSSPSPAPSSGPSGSLATTFHVGEPAPVLALPQVGGGAIDLDGLRGKPVWVNFMQTTCLPCIDEFPRMNAFAARYADRGLVVIAVDIREEEGVVAAFATSLRANFPIALDGDGAAQRAWGAYGLPVHFWIDAQGIVRDGALGGIGPDIMARGLSAILPGVEVTP